MVHLAQTTTQLDPKHYLFTYNKAPSPNNSKRRNTQKHPQAASNFQSNLCEKPHMGLAKHTPRRLLRTIICTQLFQLDYRLSTKLKTFGNEFRMPTFRMYFRPRANSGCPALSRHSELFARIVVIIMRVMCWVIIVVVVVVERDVSEKRTARWRIKYALSGFVEFAV